MVLIYNLQLHLYEDLMKIFFELKTFSLLFFAGVSFGGPAIFDIFSNGKNF